MDHLTIQFDHQLLVERPDVLAQLAQLYCETWMFDENFQEYRQCPTCKIYFSEEEVEHQGINSCDGTKSGKSHPKVALIFAWNPDEVAAEILADSSLPEFRGYLTVLPEGTVIGFTWGKVMTIAQIREKWGGGVVDQLATVNSNPNVCYYDELGVDRRYRGLGFGRELARKLTSWMRQNHPENLALLRTHKNALARQVYEKLGYQAFASDTEYGQGRVMMFVDRCRNLLTD